MIALAAWCTLLMMTTSAQAKAPTIVKTLVSGVSATTATLEADINPGEKLTRYRFEYGTEDCSVKACTPIPVPEGQIPEGSSPVRVKATAEGLTPGTIYHFRATAKNGEGGTIKGPDRTFVTLIGLFSGLPDGRAYEQASPMDKDGGDVVGVPALVKAAVGGEGISLGSTFGIPGGKGAQALPTYLALRGADNWATQGLLPPAELGERARVEGWLPDYSETFAEVTKLGYPRSEAFISQSTSGGPVTFISSYIPKAEYAYVGASEDASTVFFESEAKLPPAKGEEPIEAAIEGKQNLYAWDRASGRLSLAGVLNDGAVPPKGAFAGPYNWSDGTDSDTLQFGGARAAYYLQDTHAVTASGDIYFTAAETGQLYLRVNPTRPQSEIKAGKCTKEADACTIHVSASKRSVPDPGGAQPAAFQAASADGSTAFFTSPEKLTDDANTGPDQTAPAIGVGNVATGAIEDADFIPKRAVGVAVDSEYVYWANPIAGTIGRAEIDGKESSIDDEFIVPGPGECEVKGVTEPIPSTPRYVAVDEGHIYWSNTGLLDKDGNPVEDGGTIGRADIDGEEASIDPDFICGASNPQGLAANASHLYWANAGEEQEGRSIGRAEVDGEKVEQVFFQPGINVPHAVALSATHVYFDEEVGVQVDIGRVPLEGGEEDFLFIAAGAEIRGLATDATNLYWSARGENAIGRIPLADFPEGGICKFIPSCKKDFVKSIAGSLGGLAVDPTRLYWSSNGETLSNPGNDLYRYRHEKDELIDLTPDGAGNGAEVQGVLGASADGSRVYFAANGVLGEAGEAKQGDCHSQEAHGSLADTEGHCNVYLSEDGEISFVAQIGPGSNAAVTDALNWTGTPLELFGTASYFPKTAFASPDGATLLFRSREKLTEYDSEGVPELYRYSAADKSLRCASCPPGGGSAGEGPTLGTTGYPNIFPPLGSVSMLQSRNLSADGNRVFFDTTEALLPEDTNGQVSCTFLACRDVYEWEAPDSGSCKEGAPAYSILNGGCIYLISTGRSTSSSAFADASASGDDAFFLTADQLVRQDGDELQDVYDARVGGGLAAQNALPPVPCESTDACHGPAQTPPAEESAGSATFVGPGDAVAKTERQKARKKAKAKKHKAKKKGKAKKRANADRRAGR